MPTPLEEEKIANDTEEQAIDKLLDAATLPSPDPDAEPEDKKEPTPASGEPAPIPPASDEPPAGPAPVESDKEPTKTELRLESEAELQSRLDAFVVEKNASPQRVKMASALKDIIKEKQKLAEDYKTQLETEKAERGKVKPLTPEIEQEIEQLRTFRRLYGIENDPVLVQKYDQPIAAISKESLDLLAQWGTPEPLIKYIGENGGVANFLTSEVLMDDKKTPRSEWFDKEIYGAMTVPQKRAFDARIRQIEDITARKEREIGAAKQDTQKFEAQRQQEIQQQAQQWQTRLQKAKTDTLKQFGSEAQKKDIPVTATPEVKAEIQRHNKDIEAAEALFDSAMRATTPEEIAQIGVLAGYSQYLYPRLIEALKINKDMSDKLAEAQKKLDAISKSGRTAKQSNAPIPTGKTQPTNKLEKDDSKAMDDLLKDLP